MAPPVQRAIPGFGRGDEIRGPRRRPQDRPDWRPARLGHRPAVRVVTVQGDEVAQRRDYDLPAPAPVGSLPTAPTRSLAEWRRFDREWTALERG